MCLGNIHDLDTMKQHFILGSFRNTFTLTR